MDEFTDEEIKKLETAVPGLAPKNGLPYCMNSKSFYLSILEIYSKEDKTQELQKYIKENNIKEYSTLIHGIKGNSRTIGMENVFELCEKLQFAADAGDMDYVHSHHEHAMEVYRQSAGRLKSYLESVK